MNRAFLLLTIAALALGAIVAIDDIKNQERSHEFDAYDHCIETCEGTDACYSACVHLFPDKEP